MGHGTIPATGDVENVLAVAKRERRIPEEHLSIKGGQDDVIRLSEEELVSILPEGLTKGHSSIQCSLQTSRWLN